jgi:hypothetical protein
MIDKFYVLKNLLKKLMATKSIVMGTVFLRIVLRMTTTDNKLVKLHFASFIVVDANLEATGWHCLTFQANVLTL